MTKYKLIKKIETLEEFFRALDKGLLLIYKSELIGTVVKSNWSKESETDINSMIKLSKMIKNNNYYIGEEIKLIDVTIDYKKPTIRTYDEKHEAVLDLGVKIYNSLKGGKEFTITIKEKE